MNTFSIQYNVDNLHFCIACVLNSNGINTFVLTFSERTHRWFSYWRALAYSRYARTTQFPRKYCHILSPTVRPASIRCCTRFCRRTFVRRFLRYLCISRNCLQMHMYDFDARTITAQRVLKPGCLQGSMSSTTAYRMLSCTSASKVYVCVYLRLCKEIRL